ncbi:MAG: hypothetical protein ABIO69_08145 [Sphingomicrobium sp.]
MKRILFGGAMALLLSACQTVPPGGPYQDQPYPSAAYPGDAYPPAPYPPEANYPPSSYPAPNYPAPNYPQSSYPAPGYPAPNYPAPNYPAPGYPAPNYPPPGAYPPGPQLTCPVSNGREWRAWIDLMPGSAAPTLHVTGKVTTSSGGYAVSFDRSLQIRRGYPAQAFVTVQVSPPTGGSTQALMTHELRGEWPLGQRIDSVEIRCGEQTLASITPAAAR